MCCLWKQLREFASMKQCLWLAAGYIAGKTQMMVILCLEDRFTVCTARRDWVYAPCKAFLSCSESVPRSLSTQFMLSIEVTILSRRLTCAELGIFHVISIFCATVVPQNAAIIRKSSSTTGVPGERQSHSCSYIGWQQKIQSSRQCHDCRHNLMLQGNSSASCNTKLKHCSIVTSCRDIHWSVHVLEERLHTSVDSPLYNKAEGWRLTLSQRIEDADGNFSDPYLCNNQETRRIAKFGQKLLVREKHYHASWMYHTSQWNKQYSLSYLMSNGTDATPCSIITCVAGLFVHTIYSSADSSYQCKSAGE